ncbi:MAG: hypothetical protein F6J93_29020 [Oscillatoria sp. SIO1A7]|nr:hypothetical protein [Oscillatoria sp. SIO1A7]
MPYGHPPPDPSNPPLIPLLGGVRGGWRGDAQCPMPNAQYPKESLLERKLRIVKIHVVSFKIIKTNMYEKKGKI